MSSPPPRPKIYHITHVTNLPGIVADGRLLSDAAIIARGGAVETIGLTGIKRRRLEQLDVACHPGTRVGDYVPFYFCARSVMLYVLHCANHPDLSYRGGQDPIVHLEADLHVVIRWAESNNKPWAFTLSNAGAYYTESHSRLDALDRLDWQAIDARDFRDPDVKEKKQAEFLVHGEFPMKLVERIGVRTQRVATQVAGTLKGRYAPGIEVLPGWYF